MSDILPTFCGLTAKEILGLKQRNDELAAQVELLRKMAYEKQAVMLTKYGLDGAACKRIYALLQDLTPAQCLAEIKAQAVDEFIDLFQEHYPTFCVEKPFHRPVKMLKGCRDIYANTIRNQKGGE